MSMMNLCQKIPCAMGAGGCTDPYCPLKSPTQMLQQLQQQPFYRPAGCICPPTSEQTCKNPACPRGGQMPFTVT